MIGGDLIRAAGGKGANQAVAARRAGCEVALVAAVGDDIFGQAALKGLGAEGIDVSRAVTLAGVASGVALILVDAGGENAISVAPGANMRLSPEHVDAASDAIRGADVVLLGLEVPVETAIRAASIAAEAGVRVVLNPAPAPTEAVPGELLAAVTALTPNEHEFKAITGSAPDEAGEWASVRALLERGPEAVVLTLGRRGAVLATAGGAEHIEPFEVEAVDTVGCGDAFNGALATAIAEGRPYAGAARFAAAAGALAATRMGAQPSMPTREEIERMLAS